MRNTTTKCVFKLCYTFGLIAKRVLKSDISRLRNIVINRHVRLLTLLPPLLTHHRPVFTRTGWCDLVFFGDPLSLPTSEVFLRELISNANDALEKLRLTSLTNKDVWDGATPLNITIRAYPAEDESSARIVITGTFSKSFRAIAQR